MADKTILNGSSIKDSAGRMGRIVSVSEQMVAVAWMQKGIVAEEQSLDRTALAKDIKVLTLKEGWQSLDSLAGVHAPSVVESLVADLKSLVEGKQSRAKKASGGGPGHKKHSPYKHITHQGPAAGGSSTRETTVKNKWDCMKSGKDATYTRQKCHQVQKDSAGKYRRTGKVKNIKIKLAYKRKYNKEYKPWRSKAGW